MTMDPTGHPRPEAPQFKTWEGKQIAIDYDHEALQGKAQHILEKVSGSDEPIFILRAKDLLSVPTIVKYLNLYGEFMPSDVTFEASVVNTIEGFKQWQKDNPDKVRWPD